MHALETDYWWFAGRRALISSLLRVASKPASRGAGLSAASEIADDASEPSSPHSLASTSSSHTPRPPAPRPPAPRPLELLDIGCGTGANLPLLRGHVGQSGHVIGLDFSPLALRFAADHLDDISHDSRLPQDASCSNAHCSDTAGSTAQPSRNVALLRGDALCLPFADATFDLVTMLDVLEHLRDDRGALREVSRVLRPGGALVLSVPAYQKLWSAHDEALHHFRRYEWHGLRRLLRAGGFEVSLLSFAMSLMPPVAWLWRRLILPFQPRRPRHAQRHSEGAVLPDVSPALNRALIAYLKVEGKIIARRPLRFGTSLVAVATKVKGQK